MAFPLRKTHPLIKIISGTLVDLPTPSNISYIWNFGSLLGFCLVIQLVTGIFLSIHYTADVFLAFASLSHISRDVNYGWLIRIIHSNGARLFFIFLYIHIGRGIYYSSYSLHLTWFSGIILFFLTMITAFLGYVLPWGQISFWGATVITNLLSAIPYLGTDLVQWLWGGFAVENATLNRFFSFHFLLPFILIAFIIIHFLFLHQTGSSNPLGSNRNRDKIPFHPYFSLKDILGVFLVLFLFIVFTFLFPYLLRDPENFLPANPLVTPLHIQPEWYFLFAYAILRSIPNKLGGVLALVGSILILFILPLSKSYFSNQFILIHKTLFWFIVRIFLLLTWIGARPVEDPYIILGQILTLLYFFYFLLIPIL